MLNSSRLHTRLKLIRRFFRRYIARRIYRRIILHYVGLGVFPLVIVSFVLISLTQTTVRSYLYQRNLEIARRASNEISLFIKDPLTILTTLSQTRDIIEMEVFTQSRLIDKIKAENAIFQKINILDHTGTSVVTTSFGEEQKNFSQSDAFRVAMAGKVYFSQVYFTPSSFPIMRIALPIQKYNQSVGVLVGEIDLKAIWDLVDNITIGKTGRAFLLSSDGSVIAHPEKQRVLKEESFADRPFFKKLRNNEEGILNIFQGKAEMVAAYATVKELNWWIVVQQSAREAFSLATRMRNRVVLLVILTAVLALLLASASVKKTTYPIELLVKGVREYARGNLAHRIDSRRQDELAELAHEFNSMAKSLDNNQKKLRRMERLAALSKFAALVSHEIRNPLNAMNINIQILRRLLARPDSSIERRKKYLDIITSEIARMNSLVTNYLTISRPPELNLIRYDMHKILDEVLLMQEAEAIRSGILVEKNYTADTVSGLFDHGQLKQVFFNLFINAFQAMDGGGKLTIETTTRISKKDAKRRIIQIKIEDTGHGIPADKLKEIFDLYFTTKRTGTGLGLAIVKQIIEGHGGTIEIFSEPGVGTTVKIELALDHHR